MTVYSESAEYYVAISTLEGQLTVLRHNPIDCTPADCACRFETGTALGSIVDIFAGFVSTTMVTDTH